MSKQTNLIDWGKAAGLLYACVVVYLMVAVPLGVYPVVVFELFGSPLAPIESIFSLLLWPIVVVAVLLFGHMSGVITIVEITPERDYSNE